MNPDAAHLSNIYDLLIGIAWPLTALLIVFTLRAAIGSLFKKHDIEIQIPNGPVLRFSSSEAAETLSALFRDFIEVYEALLNEYQREVYRRILSYKVPPTVSQIIPGFDRETKEHLGCLRALRGIGLIRPETDESWNKDSRVVVTKFGASLNKYLRNSY